MSLNLQDFFTKYVLTLLPKKCKECYSTIDNNFYRHMCMQCYYNQPENPII